jgi:hypothetical protein
VYGFHFPLSVTLAHQVFSFVALTTWLKTCDRQRENTYTDHWEAQKGGLIFTGIMTVGFALFTTLLFCGQDTVQLMTVSMVHVTNLTPRGVTTKTPVDDARST